MGRTISKLFPELERLPTKKARREALYAAKSTVNLSWRYWAAITGVVVASAVIQFSLPRLAIPMTWRGTVRGVVAVVTVIACWSLILGFRKTIRRVLWRVLMDKGLPCCLSCGYDLRMLPTDPECMTICPECGCS